MSDANAALRDLLAAGSAPVPKLFKGGTHRCVPPEDTVRRVSPLFDMMGITRVADVTGLDHIGIPVVVVSRPNSRSLSVSQGKGVDLPAARASAVMESVEAWHAERIAAPVKLATYEELRWSHTLADVTALPADAGSGFHPHLDLLWTESWDLLGQTPTWVPYELVHTRFTLPRPTGTGCFLASSNGLASGNHVIEAVIHGICEVVERDATTLWHLLDPDAAAATRVDLATVRNPDARTVLDLYERAGVDVAVWETTTADIGVPSFFCVITEGDDPFRRMHSAAGMGCHPVRTVALLRALTEAAQSRLTVTAGSREDVARDDYDRVRNPDVLARERALLRGRHARSFDSGPGFDADTFDADLAWLLERLKNAGITQVLAVDLTLPHLRIPVVRVVIPGLESASMLDGWVPGPRARALRGGVAGPPPVASDHACDSEGSAR
ncbi:YcaO-like family protein [Streptomyces sp. NPDC000927]|uniref:YcaO-like family protein n=1 Tax=Streptomyces sp. NPDC000927 TaxID=3154371 RepID=UPI0033283EFF